MMTANKSEFMTKESIFCVGKNVSFRHLFAVNLSLYSCAQIVSFHFSVFFKSAKFHIPDYYSFIA